MQLIYTKIGAGNRVKFYDNIAFTIEYEIGHSSHNQQLLRWNCRSHTFSYCLSFCSSSAWVREGTGYKGRQTRSSTIVNGGRMAEKVMGLVQQNRQRPKIAEWLKIQAPSTQELQVNGKNGEVGQNAPVLVARGWKSGLELAMEVKDPVKENLQRPKNALQLCVQVIPFAFFFIPSLHYFRICQAKWVARMEWMVQVLQLMWQGVENQGSSLQRKARLLSRRAHRDQRLLYGWVSRFQQLSFPCTAILNINSILNKACSFLWCGANVNIPSLISKSNTTKCKIWSAVVISANIDHKLYASNVSMKMTMLTIFLPQSFKPLIQ